MDTARLRVLRTFPEVQALLRSFLSSRELLPSHNELINLSDMPSGIRDSIERARSDGRAWCAWRSGTDVNAVTAELDEDGSRAYKRPVLSVLLHNPSGHVIGSSIWLESEPGSWSHCPES